MYVVFTLSLPFFNLHVTVTYGLTSVNLDWMAETSRPKWIEHRSKERPNGGEGKSREGRRSRMICNRKAIWAA